MSESLTWAESSWREDDCAGETCRECKEIIYSGGRAMTVLISFPWARDVEMEAEIYLCDSCADALL